MASFAGLKQLYRYYSHIRANLSYPWLIRKEFPQSQIMIGGGAFTAFADQLIEKLPEGTIGILGEGEDAILKVDRTANRSKTNATSFAKGKQTRKGKQGSPALLDASTVDLPYLTSIFPQYAAYHGRIHRRAKQTRLPLRLCLLPLSLYRRESACGTVRRKWS